MTRNKSADSAEQRILEFAKKRFLSQGYSNVSMDELSRGLRVSKKTLYAKFPSKEALLRAAVAQHLEALQRDAEAIITGTGFYRDKLEAFMRLIYERLNWIDPYALEDIETQVPSVWHYILSFRAETVSHSLIELLEEGKRQGALQKGLESALVVQLLLASLDTLTRPDVLTSESKSAAEMVDFVITTALDGWAAIPKTA